MIECAEARRIAEEVRNEKLKEARIDYDRILLFLEESIISSAKQGGLYVIVTISIEYKETLKLLVDYFDSTNYTFSYAAAKGHEYEIRVSWE